MSVLSTGLAKTSGATGFDIDNSLRFNDNDSAYLSRTPSSAGNRKTWTWSGWVKRGNLTGTELYVFTSGTGNSGWTEFIRFNGNNTLTFSLAKSNASNGRLSTNQVFRDTSAWYHIVCVHDSSNSTSGDRIRLYVNGSRLTGTDLSTETMPSFNDDSFFINNTGSHALGQFVYSSDGYLDGYLSEVHFIDGTALTPSSFGEEDTDYKHWKPKAYDTADGAYGTNGFHLDFKVAGTGTTGAGKDVSGEGNHWATSGIASTDQMIDTPTNNFATLNTVDMVGSLTVSEGNLKANKSSDGMDYARASFGMKTGKWYWEVYAGAVYQLYPAVIPTHTRLVSGTNLYTDSIWVYVNESNDPIQYTGGSTNTDVSLANGGVAHFAYDADTNKLWYGANGTWANSGNPTTGANALYTMTSGHTYAPALGAGYGGSGMLNFGQDSSFAGNNTTTAGPYTDSNSVGDFFYQPPSGYLALCTSNLTAPAVKPQENFGIVTYAGNAPSTNAITGVGFQPDFTWIKARTTAADHNSVDSVVGTGYYLYPNYTYAAQATSASPTGINSFDSDGFTVGGYNTGMNHGSHTYVAWNWKAGNATLGTSDFTQGSIASTCSRNVDAGFSIVSYTGTGSLGTVGHGLGSIPEMIIVKNRTSSGGWIVMHKDIASDYETDYIRLDSTSAAADYEPHWADTKPTASLFTVKSDNPNTSTNAIIAYCFHSVDGYSKVGSYTGNGSPDGTFVYTGFRPAYVLIKSSTGAGQSWAIFDATRSEFNLTDKSFSPNDATAEETNQGTLDFLSNGFKLRNTDGSVNASGQTFIFIAFAEYPFKYANAK